MENMNYSEKVKSVGIVVVTYNRLSLLKEVIDALRNQSFTNFQIIIVNNGSTDKTQEWLNEQEDIITITQPNLGGAGGFFTGMKYVAEHNYEYCWIMDDDVICDPKALYELLIAIESKKNIGFVCSKVIGIDGSPMNTPIVNIESRSPITGYEDYFDMSDYNMVKVKRTTFVSVLFKCEIFFKYGLPYKDYFIWGDDTEYTTRISIKNPCYVALKSVVMHKRSIQKSLDFIYENDPKRLAMYVYKYRNEMFTKIVRKEKNVLFGLFSLLKDSFKLFLKGKNRQSIILFKAMINLINFNPTIEYPIKK